MDRKNPIVPFRLTDCGLTERGGKRAFHPGRFLKGRLEEKY
jgi:hypothetical protein